ITVATFHALSLRIVSEQHERLGLAADAHVADEAERLAALTTVLGDEKAARRAARDTAPGEEYLAELHRRGLLDVAELVELAGRLLEEYPEVRAEYRRRFRWLFVDEYQDIDPMQYRLLRALAPADAGLCVIGDPDQSIYRFRGAEVGFFLRFTTDYPNAQSYTLSRNYRSTASVVSLAAAVVRPASLVPDREFIATQGAGTRPSLYRAEHAASEAAEVARAIDELVGGSSFHSLDTGRVKATARGHRIGFGDIAVLYRTDAQSTPLVAALDRAGVPYQKRGHDPLAKRPGVPELVHELRYADSAILNSAPAGDGADAKLDDQLDRAARVLASTQPAAWQARELLRPLAERCADAESFCSQVLLDTEVDALDPRADTVSLLTLHAAKGLEFPVVFLIGCDDRTLPLRFGGDEGRDEEEIREERRLLFVGITRARERLFLSHPRQRNRGETVLDVRISPFLAGLGAEYLDVGEMACRQRSSPAARQLRLL
ncbi:MAG TPA: ATP-dependent helicase, partial [Mycobacteriales bacterium]|nr:ATP-dependent helicase [Mycobacteriales bacterium]